MCDIISLRTKDANWTAPRKLVFDFTGYVIENLGIETATTYSFTKPHQRPCSNDLRVLGLNQSKIPYTYIDWQNSHGEYSLRWTDVQVTCTGTTGSQCSHGRSAGLGPLSHVEETRAYGGL
jgi:hypothetical protein